MGAVEADEGASMLLQGYPIAAPSEQYDKMMEKAAAAIEIMATYPGYL